MAGKFNPKDYKSLGELFPEAPLYDAVTLLNPHRPVYETREIVTATGEKRTLIFINSEKLLESRLALGCAEDGLGEKIQISGYPMYGGSIVGDDLYQLNLMPDQNRRDNFVICYVDAKRDGRNSRVLANTIAAVAQHPQQGVAMPEKPGEQPVQAAQQNMPAQITIFGTLQRAGHVYIDVDAVVIGNNLLYHRRAEQFGFKQK